MRQQRKFAPPSPNNRAKAGLRPTRATRLGVDVQPARMPANYSKPAKPSSESLLSDHHSPIPRTRAIKGVLGGRSATCPECSRGNSDITDQREALPACAGSSAQAFKREGAARLIMYEMSSDHRPPMTAVLIDTPAIRIAVNSIPCIADSHSNRHSSRPSAHISARCISFISNSASQPFESFARRISSVPYGLSPLAAARGSN
jgi:hypothetical protein